MPTNQTYIALLRGINVGGHHKVPMADLRKTMENLGYQNVKTLLNSGNVVFDANAKQEAALEQEIASHLAKIFGFPVPVLVRNAAEIKALIAKDPFKEIEVTGDIRCYVTFLNDEPKTEISLPMISEDKSFKIIAVENRAVCSVLDVSVTKTPKAMEVLEKLYGKNITTRNWNTLTRITGIVD